MCIDICSRLYFAILILCNYHFYYGISKGFLLLLPYFFPPTISLFWPKLKAYDSAGHQGKLIKQSNKIKCVEHDSFPLPISQFSYHSPKDDIFCSESWMVGLRNDSGPALDEAGEIRRMNLKWVVVGIGKRSKFNL